jgi:hypothetical protein
MANDRLLQFMAQPPKVEKRGEFGVTAQFVLKYSLHPSATVSNSFLPRAMSEPGHQRT